MSQEALTELEIMDWKAAIDAMSHREMARLFRFAPSGHPVFRSDQPVYEYFKKKFDDLGGMTSALSKEIGWNE